MSNSNGREIVKGLTGLTLMLGTGRIVGSAIKNNVTATTLPQKFSVGVASFAIGGMLTEMVTLRTEKKIDALFDYFEGKKEIKIV